MYNILDSESKHSELAPFIEQLVLHSIQQNIRTIAEQQDPNTGLLPAAVQGRANIEGHYTHAWIRDNSIVDFLLLDPYLLSFLKEQDSNLYELSITISQSSIRGMLSLFSTDQWKKAFMQKILEEKNPQGIIQYTYLSDLPPPIHLKTDGTECRWFEPNQPDSFGAFLIALNRAQSCGYLNLTDNELIDIQYLINYLINIQIEHFKCSSMWEGPQVHSPTPLSTVAIVTRGLFDWQKRLSSIPNNSLASRSRRAIANSIRHISDQFPIDYTMPQHIGIVDLSTQVAINLGAFDMLTMGNQYMSLAGYYTRATKLGNGHHPGKERFHGDPYYYQDNYGLPHNARWPAVWPMALPMETSFFLENAIKSLLKGDLTKGGKYFFWASKRLNKALQGINNSGYYPELYIHKEGDNYAPNENDLLWYRALMCQATAMYIHASNMFQQLARR